MYHVDIGQDVHAKLDHIKDRIFQLLGPAIADMRWGLMRPGLLVPDLASSVALMWRARSISPIVSIPPNIYRPWVIFDYLFSRTTHLDPLFSLLKTLGMVKMSRDIAWDRALPEAHLVTVGINVKNGLMIFLHNGSAGIVRSDLNNLAYVLGHILKSYSVRRVILEDVECMGEVAHNLSKLEEQGWDCVTWKTSGGKAIPKEVRRGWSREEYERKLRDVDWRRLEFENRKFGSIWLSVSQKALKNRKAVTVSIKEGVYRVALQRIQLLPSMFEVLSEVIAPKKFETIEMDMDDRAGILKAYTERRGVVASACVVRKLYGVEPNDVSYDFVGYDLDAGANKIEVKTFRGSIDEYSYLTLTRNECEKMKSVEGYRIFVVENAWGDNPQVKVISDPRRLKMIEDSEDRLTITTVPEAFYRCPDWKDHVDKEESGEV
jgi:hypothetical protein